MHVYAFGSVCRGDIEPDSDIDLLAITDGYDSRFNTDNYSVYSYKRIKELWDEGNPFAWHLALESKLLFSSEQNDFLRALGNPRPYSNCLRDCKKFFTLFREARASISHDSASKVFDLSAIFLSVRNIASCFSLGVINQPNFSRNAARRLDSFGINISSSTYQTLERARILCTRGLGNSITPSDIEAVALEFDEIESWMGILVKEAKAHE